MNFPVRIFLENGNFWGQVWKCRNDLAHRVEVLSGACGASFWLKSSREVRIGHKCTFFQSFRKFGKWEVPKKMLAIRSELFLGGCNRSGVNRWPGGRAMSGKRPSPSRKVRVWPISLAGYPIFDLARSGLQGPRICTAQRETVALVDTSTLVHPGTLRGKPAVS